MLEHADGSEMCISVMTVFLKSLCVAFASGEMAEFILSTWVSSAYSQRTT